MFGILVSWPLTKVQADSEAVREKLQSSESADELRNEDITRMLNETTSSDVIIAKIAVSKVAFEVSPLQVEGLRKAGVPEAIIEAMVEAMRSRPGSAAPTLTQESQESLVPDGTRIEIECAYPMSSLHFKPGDEISFRVANAIIIDGIALIEAGATATGRIEKSKRGGHWGKAGLLTWTMKSVAAVDGSQIPLRVQPMRLRGDSKGAKVATGMIVTGALLPLIAPVALLHGFKRGGDAYIPAGKRYEVYADGAATVKKRGQ